MVGEWIKKSLGDLIDIKHGFAFWGEFFRDGPPGNILLTPGNFAIGGGFKADKFKYYDGPVPDEFVLREGDLIVTMTDLSKNADTLGYPALVPSASQGRQYLHNQRLGKVVAKDKDAVDFRYLHYLMCSKEYRHEVTASATGTTVKHTSPERIKRFRFLLPSPPEQRTVAHILGTLDDKIELNRRMNETLEAVAQSIFKAWFVDAVKDGLPQGWRESRIGEEVRVVGGSTPSTGKSEFWDDGTFHWATPKDLSTLTSPALLGTERRITAAGLDEISSGLLPVGTVLLSSRAPIGYLAVSEVPVAVNQGFIAMVCDGMLPNHYVRLWANENMEAIRANANGTTFPEISKKNFRPLPVIVPPNLVLDDFVRQVESLYRRMVSNLRESRTLAAIRDVLLPKLLSGEIQIRVPVANERRHEVRED